MDKVDRPKRFYKAAHAVPLNEGWTVHLDGRALKTHAKAALLLPTQALAEAIAKEWNDQGEELDLHSMTLTRLANVAIDRTPETRAEMVAEVTRYGETDVTCYLADAPEALQKRQDSAWRPWRDWAGQELGIMLVPVIGLMASPQPQASLDRIAEIAAEMDDYALTGLAWGCSLFGSIVLALAVSRVALSGEQALSASCVDEDWQIEQWGEDDEAKSVRARRLKDAKAIEVWFKALAS